MTTRVLRIHCTIAAAVLLLAACFAADKDRRTEDIVRLQVWLDRENFGPGKIDGKGGEFTSKALSLYKEAHPEVSLQNYAPSDFHEPPFVEYQIREPDSQEVGQLPKTREEQATLKKLPYESLADFVAERYHTDPKFLASVNSDLNLASLQAGDVVRVPNVLPFELEKLHDSGTTPNATKQKSLVVDINTKEELLLVKENEKTVAAFPITAGSDQLPAPIGSWKVESITTLPDFRWDPVMLNEGKRGPEALKLPPGPRNPVGVFWMGLNKTGIGIHGTDNPWTIGRSASHGCIRLSNWDAAKLASMVTSGVRVEIH